MRNVSGMMHWGRPFGPVVSNVPGLKAAAVQTARGISAEAVMPWKEFKIEPGQDVEVGFMVLAYDPSQLDPQFKQGNDFRPRILENRKTLDRLRLAENADTPPDNASWRSRHYGYDLLLLEIPVRERECESSGIVCAAASTGSDMRTELSIPWTTLAGTGMTENELALSIDAPESLAGLFGDAVTKFEATAHSVYAQPKLPPVRRFSVRLYFIEPDAARPGERVFDISMQGTVAARNVDISREAGGPRTALVKEFTGITAGQTLSLELTPRGTALTKNTVPVLNAIEIRMEDPENTSYNPAGSGGILSRSWYE
jgi:hypothetical protein